VNITDVRIKLMGTEYGRLMAFCAITIDDAFVVYDLKIVNGDKGIFIGMPDRKIRDHCPKCSEKNHRTANFCNRCGKRLARDRVPHYENGNSGLFAPIAHPINQASREAITAVIMKAYYKEVALSKNPGYVCRYDMYRHEVVSEAVG